MKNLRPLLCFIVFFSAGCACSEQSAEGQRPPPEPVVGPVKTERVWPPERTGYINPIPAENALPGDPDWYGGLVATGREIEGYVNRTSARAGDVVEVHASADAQHPARWTLYRLGWYGGARARAVATGDFEVSRQAECELSRETGVVECDWAVAFSVRVDPAWVSGLYLFALRRDDGYTRFAPLVITDERPADLVLQSTENTAQAYNDWMGQSLYADAAGVFTTGLALQASFNRPYAQDRGAGHVLRYEALAAAFLERHGYDITYTTNGEVSARGAEVLTTRGAYLSVGHDEYWTGQARDAVERARDAGMPLLFLGANVAYWKIRTAGGVDASNPRVITCFKANPEEDPERESEGRTGRYRDEPIARPENALVGTMYESYLNVSSAWRVVGADGFLYAGTGLRDGDTLPFLVGYEYDRVFDNGQTPASVEVVARSGIVDARGVPSWSDAVAYRAPSGAFVFGAASIEFVWGLGDARTPADPRVERMFANLLKEALGLPVPDGVGEGARPKPHVRYERPAERVDVHAKNTGALVDGALLPDGRIVATSPRTHELFIIEPDGTRALLAGDGKESRKPEYDNVPGLKARFFQPVGVVRLPSGDVLVADTYNHALRLVSMSGDHVVRTVAGALGKSGRVDGVGAQARFRSPTGLGFNPKTGRVLVADTANNRVREVDPQTWEVTTLTGFDPEYQGVVPVRFGAPTAVTADAEGRVYVVASGDYALVRVDVDSARTVTTIAGGKRGDSDGNGADATLAIQGGIAWDGDALIVSEPGLNRLRRITPGKDAKTTHVETLAGNGRFGARSGGGEEAELALPVGLVQAPEGKLFVMTPGTEDIRVVTLPGE